MISLLVLLSLAVVRSEELVEALTADTFDAAVSKEGVELTLVEFYAPWCGHCKRLAPELEKAMKRIQADGKAVSIVKVNAEDERDLAGEFDVKGYPTLFTFRGSRESVEPYEGPREADGIVSFLYKQIGPVVSEIEASGVEAFLADESDTAVVATATGADADAFRSFASAHRNKYRFALVDGTPSKLSLHVRGGDVVEHSGEFTSEAIAAFIDSNKFPVVGEISQDNYRDYVERGLPLCWVFVDDDEAATKALVADLVTAATPYASKISVVYLSGKQYGGMASRLGLDASTLPVMGIDNHEANKKYKFDGEFTVESLTTFFKGFDEGSLESFMKSEDVPNPNPGEDGVFVLTGKTFEAEALAGDDVLIEFYAPWCGHCKSLAPEYSSLANAMASSPNLKIAKLDGTANDVPVEGFSFTGFPTLYFQPGFKEGESRPKPLEYKGGRNKDDLEDFVRKNAVHAL